MEATEARNQFRRRALARARERFVWEDAIDRLVAWLFAVVAYAVCGVLS